MVKNLCLSYLGVCFLFLSFGEDGDGGLALVRDGLEVTQIPFDVTRNDLFGERVKAFLCIVPKTFTL